MESKYTRDFQVACFFADHRRIMRPAAFLDLAQHMATNAADVLSFGDEQLSALNCAWVLARMKVEFHKPVHFNDVIKMETWHRGMNGLYFIRDFKLFDNSGDLCVTSTSSWIVMNIETRSIARDSALNTVIPAKGQCDDFAIEVPAGKVVMPRNCEPEVLGSHKVVYSDLDFNMHVNNVKYTVWALDMLPEELVFNKMLKELTINFNKEVHMGETVDFYHKETDGAHIVEGRVGNTQVFIIKLIFE